MNIQITRNKYGKWRNTAIVYNKDSVTEVAGLIVGAIAFGWFIYSALIVLTG